MTSILNYEFEFKKPKEKKNLNSKSWIYKYFIRKLDFIFRDNLCFSRMQFREIFNFSQCHQAYEVKEQKG